MTAEQRLAPHVDAAWAQRFILEARLLELSGPRIGDALREVDGHCVDSGEDAREAFGDPAEYAASLAELNPPERSSQARTVAPVGVQTLGMMVAFLGAGASAGGRPAEVTAGWAATLALLLIVDLLLAFAADAVLRVVARRPVLSVLAFTGVVVLVALGAWGLGALVDAPALELPPWPVLIAGLAVVAAGAVWGRVVAQRERADPLVDPEDPGPSRDAPERMLFAVLPVVTLLGCVLLAGLELIL
ncbi:hypothetical protein [Rothia halotolerans]|uniref:hypothetical protein n=1 Tax=Rothia halotolerans TaxID=405770 RepID=UPI00101C053D|nr:hypothetical protein [Rothia halotolerans]